MISIRYRDVPIGALENQTITFNNKQPWVNENDLKNEIIQVDKYGTLEQDFYLLDGTYKDFPNEPTNMEYMSEEMSDANGNFAQPIVMTRTFTNRYSSTGLTIKFDTNTGDYCPEVTIQWYRDEELLLEKTVYPTSKEFVSNQLVEAFNKVILTFYKTSKPYRYLKIYYLIDGLVRIFEDNELTNIQITEQISETAEELPMNTLDFKIIAQSELSYLFQSKQPMQLYRNNLLIGNFFIDKVTQQAFNTFKLNMFDYIGILDAERTMGGIYNNIPLATLVTEILGTIPYELDASFSNIMLNGYIPICTKREALQQIAFSIGAIIDTSRSNLIMIKPYSSIVLSVLGTDKVFKGIETEISSLVTKVEIIEHNYSAVSESVNIYEGILNDTIKIEFNEPIHSLSITNGTIGESGVNYAIISGTGNTVVLTGQKYSDNTKIITRENMLTTASTIEKVKKYENTTLVTSSNSSDVADRISAICFLNKKIKSKIILNNELVGDKVTIATEYGNKNARILLLELDITNQNKYAEAELLEV